MKSDRVERTLQVFAVLFALLAISNLLKPLELYPDHGFVLFGQRLHGPLNAIMGPLFGLFLLAYAAAIWRGSPWALTMARLYAAYVVVNLITWRIVQGNPKSTGEAIFALVYMAVAVGVSSGTWLLLARRRAGLG